MPVTIFHSLTATTPDNTSYEIRPSHWNSGHAASINAVGSEISGAFSNGGNVSFGLDGGGHITGSAPAGGGGALTISGAGSSISNGQLIFSNSNGVSFGMNGSTMTASVAAVGGAQTGISSVAGGGTTYTSGQIQFFNSNNFTFLSTTGQGFVGSFSTSQSVQTQASGNIPRTGFTTNATAGVVLVGTHDTAGLNVGVPAWITTWTAPAVYVSSVNGSSGAISLNVGSSLSASTNGSSITFGLASNITTALQSAGAYLTTAAQSSVSNVSGILAATNNTGGGTGTLSGNVSFSDANGISFYSSAGNAIVGSYNSTQFAGTGTTFGGTNVSGSMTMNSNGLVLSLSAPTPGGGAAINFSAGTTSGNLQTIVFSNSNGVSFGLNGSTITASAAGGGGGVAIAASNSTFTSGTVVLGVAGGAMTITNGIQSALFSVPATSSISATGIVSISVNASTISIGAPAFSGGISGGNTAGNTGTVTNQIVFAGGNNITVSGSTNAGGMTITMSGPNTSVVPTSYVSQVNGSSGAVSMAVGSSLSSSTNGSSITWGLASNITTALQSAGAYLTTAAQSSVSNVSGMLAATNNTGGGTATLSGNISFSNANSMTFYTSVGNAIVGSFSTSQSVQTQASGNIAGAGFTSTTTAGSVMVGTHNSAGLSLGIPNWLTVAAGGAFSAGASTDAAGTTGLVGGQIVFFEGANVSLSQSINGISASLSISAAAGGGAGFTGSWFQPEVWGSMVSASLAQGTVYFRPVELDGAYDIDMLLYQQSVSSQASSTLSFSGSVNTAVNATSSSSGTGSYAQSLTALWFSRVNTNETNASYNSIVTFDSKTYSLGQGYSASVAWGMNTSSASCSVTTSWGISFIKNIDGAGGITTGSSGTSGSTTFSTTSTNINSFSSSFVLSGPYAHVSGIRPIFFPQAGSNLSAGEYWMGLIQSTNTGSTNMSLQRPLSYATQAFIAFSGSTQNSYLEYGNSVNMSTSNYRPGFGSYSASSNTTANIALSQISILASNESIWFAAAGKTL